MYTRRSGKKLEDSSSGEITWRLAGANDATCGFETATPDTFQAGYACNDQHKYQIVEDAKTACCECSECNGVTCTAAGDCSIRKNGAQIDSPFGETSYAKTSGQTSCLHMEGTLGGGDGSIGLTTGYGTVIVDIEPDLESFHIRAEYFDLSAVATGMHLHDPDLILKAVFLCADDMGATDGVCDRTIRRGDESGYMTWDILIQGLLGNLGYVVVVNTPNFPIGELWADLYCDGIIVDLPHYDCNIGENCPLELYNCFNDYQCISWMTMYSFDLCHFDIGRVAALSTPASECFALLSLPTTVDTFPLAEALSTCITSCVPTSTAW